MKVVHLIAIIAVASFLTLSNCACVDPFLSYAPRALEKCKKLVKFDCADEKLCVDVNAAFDLRICAKEELSEAELARVRRCITKSISFYGSTLDWKACMTLENAKRLGACLQGKPRKSRLSYAEIFDYSSTF